jgi:hypothetical protein
MTLVETFMATQTEVLRQILQTQQQITQQMQQRPPMGANHDGPHMVTTYSQFIGMKPPTFTKAEEPLDANAWVRAIEAKFSAFSYLVPRSARPALQLLTVNSCIKVSLYLQADKSPVVVNGPFFPRVVNPRYRIRGTNV